MTRTAKKSGAISNLADFGAGRTQKEVDDLKQALAGALKDKQDLTKQLAEKERSVEEFKFHLDEAQQFIDDMMDKEDPKKKLARPARSGAPSALSQPRSHAPSAQSEVDEAKEKSQKALGLPSLPPRAQLTMILDLDFSSTGAEGMTMKMRLEMKCDLNSYI